MSEGSGVRTKGSKAKPKTKKKPCEDCKEKAKASEQLLKSAVQASLESGFLKKVREKSRKQQQLQKAKLMKLHQQPDPLQAARDAVLKDALSRNLVDEQRRGDRQFQEEQRRYLREQADKQALALTDLGNKLQVDLHTAIAAIPPKAPPLPKPPKPPTTINVNPHINVNPVIGTQGTTHQFPPGGQPLGRATKPPISPSIPSVRPISHAPGTPAPSTPISPPLGVTPAPSAPRKSKKPASAPSSPPSTRRLTEEVSELNEPALPPPPPLKPIDTAESEAQKFNLAVDLFNAGLNSSDASLRNILPKYFGLTASEIPQGADFYGVVQIAQESAPNFQEKYNRLIESMSRTRGVANKQALVSDPISHSNRLLNILKNAKSGKGAGPNDDQPHSHLLYDEQIADYMQPLEKLGFLGVYMSDEIRVIPPRELQKRGSLIMNVQPSHDAAGHENPGEHWVSLYWDLRHENEGNYKLHWEQHPHNQGVFYYDPFGRAPSDQMLKDIKVLLDKIIHRFDIDYQIEFQHNVCKHQDLRSFECGYFAMAWLVDMYNDFNPAEYCCHEGKKESVRDYEHHIKQFEKDLHAGVPVNKMKQKIL